MLRSSHCFPLVLVVASLPALCGCGGGSSAPPPPAPPAPQPDFSLSFSQNSVSVQQGLTSSAVSLSVEPLNGFSGQVQVTLGGLPPGVTSNPTSPFSANANSSIPLVFSAASNAGTGNFAVVATATSGSLSHPANLALFVQSAPVGNLPRTAYIRTDSVPSLDDPSGEPHHRHLAYDSAHQLVFVANRAMNRVEILSSSNAQRAGDVNFCGASSADLSADGSTVWIGSATETLAEIDTTSLQLMRRHEIAGLQPIPNTLFDRPEEALALSSGKLLLRLRQSQSAEALLALWDPSSNSLTNLTSTEPALFQNGLGAMARSGDHTRVLVAANDSSGEIAVYDSNGSVAAGPHGLGTGTIPLVAVNPDATRFAVEFVSNGATQILLLDSAFQLAGAYSATAVYGMVFSTDGQFLYVSENLGVPAVITALDGHTLKVVGQIPDLYLAGRRSEIEDVDSTHYLFAAANRGVSFLDAAHPASLPAPSPTLASPPIAQPSGGPSGGGTAVALSGQNFEPSAQLFFGGQSAASVVVNAQTSLTAISPPNSATGAVNLTAYFPSGWLALAPEAFSYGPQILQILPNAGSPAGNDVAQIYGYGFGSDATKVTVTIGGANATVQKSEDVTAIAPSLGLDPTYPFPLERLTVQTPPGTSGQADVVVSAPAGSSTAPRAFQYLQSEAFYAKPSFDKFILYDHGRQRLYLSNIDHVDVFDLAAGAFRSSGLASPGGPPPTAELRGLALTPDNTQLVIADFGAQNIYLLNPDNGGGTAVAVGGVPGFGNSGPARVAATSTQAVFVGLSAESSSSGSCTSCLGQMNLTASPPTIAAATQPEVTSLTGAPLVQANGNGNQVFVAFGNAPGGALALWNSSTPNQFATFTANAAASDLGASSDGNAFALQVNGTTEIRGSDFFLSSAPAKPELAQIPGRVQVPGVTLHPSGALLYQPFLTGQPGAPGVQGGIDILDARSGALRLRILLPQQFMTDVDGLHGSFFTTDETGRRLFAITSKDGTAQNAGLTLVTLASVPLAIGSLVPSQGAAAGGVSVVIRGSGFQSGVSVSIGGKPATTTLNDMNTLTVVTPALAAGPQRVTISNADGETVSLDAAFIAN